MRVPETQINARNNRKISGLPNTNTNLIQTLPLIFDAEGHYL